MSVTFFIGPFDPALWADGPPTEPPISNLCIDSQDYGRKLRKHWPYANVYIPPVPSSFLLRWELNEPDRRGILGGLQNQHYVSFGWAGVNFIEFILWHRSVIPAIYSLFLFNSSSWDYLELKLDTTEQDIVDFTGIRNL